MVTLGCMPVHEVVPIDKGIDVWANFGTHYFLERREIGMFNIGKDSTGIVVADGVRYELGYKDCLYITQGTKEVSFASADPDHPAKFYMVSAPAHCAYQTRLIKMADANHRPLGSVETCNKRTINQFIHPDVLKTCQLSMGMTELEPGSNWNTMPSHTHERRMEIYTYFEVPGVPHVRRTHPDPPHRDAQRGRRHQPLLEHPQRRRHLQLHLYLGHGRREHGVRRHGQHRHHRPALKANCTHTPG